jgi:tRNA (guanine-N7-)-methyltransferase
MIELLFSLQRTQSKLFFKTDSSEAFEWCLTHFLASRYKVLFVTRDLHQSEKASSNFVTQFESIFIRKGLPIYYLEVEKPSV